VSSRVVSTAEAKSAAQRMIATNNTLMEQLRQLQQSNQILCDPNQWDGPPAAQWRSQAPSALQNLQSTFQKFETDFQQLRNLLENVLVAGGAG
jgi:uncharacterized protein YukE